MTTTPSGSVFLSIACAIANSGRSNGLRMSWTKNKPNQTSCEATISASRFHPPCRWPVQKNRVLGIVIVVHDMGVREEHKRKQESAQGAQKDNPISSINDFVGKC